MNAQTLILAGLSCLLLAACTTHDRAMDNGSYYQQDNSYQSQQAQQPETIVRHSQSK